MKKLTLPKHFCPQPFDYIYTNVRGTWRPCCKATTDVSVAATKETSFEEWWFENKNLNDLRDEFLTKPGERIKNLCDACFGPESRGITSYRQEQKVTNHTLDCVKNYKNTGMSLAKGRFMMLKPKGFSNTCNLACYMCSAHISSKKYSEALRLNQKESFEIFGYTSKEDMKEKTRPLNKKINTDKNLKKYLDLIENYGHHVNNVNLSGGEPTLIDGNFRILDKLIETGHSKYVHLHFNSNLSKKAMYEKNFIEYIDKFKRVNIQGSIDHIFEKDEWIRYPTKFKEVIKNFEVLKNFKNVNVSANITWSLLNVEDAKIIVEWFAQNNIKIARPINFVHFPKELHVSNHPYREKLSEEYMQSENFIIKSIGKELKLIPDNNGLIKAIKYIKELDSIRKTDATKLWRWINDY